MKVLSLVDCAIVHTEQTYYYRRIAEDFSGHHYVRHSDDEYVRGDVDTNTIEGFFSILKRRMRGVYQHCGKSHLHRYMAEFDFRYSNRATLEISDTVRADIALMGVVGKRLTYETIGT